MTAAIATPPPAASLLAGCGRPLWRAALVVAVAFPLLGVGFRLNLFADASLFSYGVAACDAWEFHFRQIPTRISAFLLSVLPGQVLGCLVGRPALGVAAYAVLFFSAPLLGLLATRAADRAGTLLPWAALSVLLLCPLVFGFPSELWVALAAAWPAFVLCHAPGGRGRQLAAALAFAILACGHEAGLVTAFVILAALAIGPGRGRALRFALPALLPGLLAWLWLKLAIRNDPYLDEVLARVMLTFITPRLILGPSILFPLAIPAVLALAWLLTRRWWLAGAAALLAAALFWLVAGIPLHAEGRYYARSMLFAGTAALLLAAALDAAGWLRWPRAWAARGTAARRRLVLGTVALCLALHAVQLGRFLVLWADYRQGIAALAMGEAADPALGAADFVGSDRLGPRFAPVAWHSTTPFLGVLVTPGMDPPRLVVDPAAGYFWFDCAAATRSAARPLALPAAARDKLRRYTCLHR